MHVGAVREQRRRHVRVPVGSGGMERRPPAAERARAHTAQREMSAAGKVAMRVRLSACSQAGVCVQGTHACMRVSTYFGMPACM